MSTMDRKIRLSQGPIILPIMDDPIDDKEDDGIIFKDKRLGPWDGNWVLETVPLREGEWVVYFCSNLVNGVSTGIEIIDDGPYSIFAADNAAGCSGDCSGTGRRKSRKYGTCDEEYLKKLCRKAAQDAKANARANCKERCECANGSFTPTTRNMKNKGDYCKYRCYGDYAGQCVKADSPGN